MDHELIKKSAALMALLQKDGDAVKPFAREIPLVDVLLADTRFEHVAPVLPMLKQGTEVDLQVAADGSSLAVQTSFEGHPLGRIAGKQGELLAHLMEAGKQLAGRIYQVSQAQEFMTDRMLAKVVVSIVLTE